MIYLILKLKHLGPENRGIYEPEGYVKTEVEAQQICNDAKWYMDAQKFGYPNMKYKLLEEMPK